MESSVGDEEKEKKGVTCSRSTPGWICGFQTWVNRDKPCDPNNASQRISGWHFWERVESVLPTRGLDRPLQETGAAPEQPCGRHAAYGPAGRNSGRDFAESQVVFFYFTFQWRIPCDDAAISWTRKHLQLGNLMVNMLQTNKQMRLLWRPYSSLRHSNWEPKGLRRHFKANTEAKEQNKF